MHVGDRVPADTRIIALRTATLRAEQSSLTGESVAVLKSVEAVEEEGCELQAKVSPFDRSYVICRYTAACFSLQLSSIKVSCTLELFCLASARCRWMCCLAGLAGACAW